MKYKTVVLVPMSVREEKPITIRNSAKVWEVMKDESKNSQETMFVLTLDIKGRLITKHMIHMGDYDSCPLSPRVALERALLDQASAIILVHNHPSGDPIPSAEDIRITKKLIEAAKIIGIEIVDHIIIGRGVTPFMSMREMGMVNFCSIGD